MGGDVSVGGGGVGGDGREDHRPRNWCGGVSRWVVHLRYCGTMRRWMGSSGCGRDA